MAKRRGDGEGSIYQAKDGRWRAEVSLGYKPDGKPIRKVFYGKTRTAVATELRRLLDAKDDGLNLKPSVLTVGVFLQSWLAIKRTKRRSQTCRSYEWIIRRHLTPGLGRISLSKLTAQQVQDFLLERYASGLKPATVKHIHATLRAALTHARKMKEVRSNVARDVEVPTVERFEASFLTPEQARKFMAVAMTAEGGLPFVVGLTTGLRKGEILGLRWADVEFSTGTLRVRNALERRKGQGLVLCSPKSNKSRRSLQMPAITVQALKEQARRQASEKQWADSTWQETDHVFTNSTGSPLTPESLMPKFRAILKVAQLPTIRIHDLRHSVASLLLSQGVPLKMVSELLGHSTYSLTADTYSHISEAGRSEVADRMNAVFSERSPTPTASPTKTEGETIQ